jgi:hypothetical protein
MIYQTVMRHILHSHRCENLRYRTKVSDWHNLVSYHLGAVDETEMDFMKIDCESVGCNQLLRLAYSCGLL